ncbi:MAG: hypothetical protein AB7I04_01980 [Pseudomonadales bacterium]
MSFLKTTPPSEATGAVRTLYERQQGGWGFVPNYARPFSHRPEIMSLWADLQRGIRSHVAPRRFELATLAAALALRSSYCSLAHGKALLEWYSEAEVRAIVSGGEAAAEILTPAEMAMMDYAGKAATRPWQVTAGEVAGLRHHGFSDAEIFDIAAVATARAFFSGVVEAVGGEPDSSFLEMDEPLRELLTVGRPIDFRPVERLPDADAGTAGCQAA